MIDKLIPPHCQMLAAVAGAALLLAGAFGAGWTVNGWRIGKAQAEEKLTDATTALETLTGRIENAGKRAADLETGLAGLRAAASQARKDIQDVLPKDDRTCDLPAAARGVLNRSSGYAD